MLQRRGSPARRLAATSRTLRAGRCARYRAGPGCHPRCTGGTARRRSRRRAGPFSRSGSELLQDLRRQRQLPVVAVVEQRARQAVVDEEPADRVVALMATTSVKSRLAVASPLAAAWYQALTLSGAAPWSARMMVQVSAVVQDARKVC